MADDKLLTALSSGLASGMNEQQVKEKLVKDGWNVTDVNGAYALHMLSLKPIGSNLISSWKQSAQIKKETGMSQLFRAIGFIGLLCIVGVAVDWYGYTLPFLKQYEVRTYIEHTLGTSVLSASVGQQEGTTTQVK